MPRSPKTALVISANCRNIDAYGDYQIAGQLAYQFSKELPIPPASPVFKPISLCSIPTMGSPGIEEVILLTTDDRLHAFTHLYGARNTHYQVKILDTLITVYSDSEFPVKDYLVTSYIAANPCRDIPETSLKRILSPGTNMLEVFGPHQPDIKGAGIASYQYMVQKIASLHPGSISFYLPIQFPEALGFMHKGGARLGLFPIQSADMLTITDAEQAQLSTLVTEGNYAPLYLNSKGSMDREILEFIELSSPQTSNYVFIGNYATELKSIIKKSPYSVCYEINGVSGSYEKLAAQSQLTLKHFSSIENNAFRKIMAKGIPLVVASGVNCLQECLLDARIVYLQDVGINSTFVNDYTRALTSYAQIQPQMPMLKDQSIKLATILMKSKPLSSSDKTTAIQLLADQNVVQTLQNYNQALMLASQAPIAQKLLPTLLKPIDSSQMDPQVEQALKAMKRPGENMPPSYEQALRRAAGTANHTFELKVLIAYSAQRQCNIDSSTPDKHITPLHYAAQAGLYLNLILLVQAGADPDRLDYQRRNAAYYAAKQGHSECLNDLIELGANITNCAQDGNSALTLYHSSPSLRNSPILVRSIEVATPSIESKAANIIQTQFLGFFARKRLVPNRKEARDTQARANVELALIRQRDQAIHIPSEEKPISKRQKLLDKDDNVIECSCSIS